jgi:hypothetical protein
VGPGTSDLNLGQDRQRNVHTSTKTLAPYMQGIESERPFQTEMIALGLIDLNCCRYPSIVGRQQTVANRAVSCRDETFKGNECVSQLHLGWNCEMYGYQSLSFSTESAEGTGLLCDPFNSRVMLIRVAGSSIWSFLQHSSSLSRENCKPSSPIDDVVLAVLEHNNFCPDEKDGHHGIIRYKQAMLVQVRGLEDSLLWS